MADAEAGTIGEVTAPGAGAGVLLWVRLMGVVGRNVEDLPERALRDQPVGLDEGGPAAGNVAGLGDKMRMLGDRLADAPTLV